MVNKTEGNRFEREFCEILGNDGFWAHNMAQSSSGQPADIICVKDGIAYLVDCKVCHERRFDFSRIEPNQRRAFEKWTMSNNKSDLAFVALKVDGLNGYYFLDWRRVLELEENGRKSISGTDFYTECWNYDDWTGLGR